MVCLGNRRSRAAVFDRICGLAAMLGVAAVLSSCNSATMNSVAPADVDPLDKIRSLDIMPKQADAVGTAGTGRTDSGQHARAAVYEGTEITDVADARMRPIA